MGPSVSLSLSLSLSFSLLGKLETGTACETWHKGQKGFFCSVTFFSLFFPFPFFSFLAAKDTSGRVTGEKWTLCTPDRVLNKSSLAYTTFYNLQKFVDPGWEERRVPLAAAECWFGLVWFCGGGGCNITCIMDTWERGLCRKRGLWLLLFFGVS